MRELQRRSQFAVTRGSGQLKIRHSQITHSLVGVSQSHLTISRLYFATFGQCYIQSGRAHGHFLLQLVLFKKKQKKNNPKCERFKQGIYKEFHLMINLDEDTYVVTSNHL